MVTYLKKNLYLTGTILPLRFRQKLQQLKCDMNIRDEETDKKRINVQ